MIDVIPAVLPKTISELEEGLRKLRNLSPLVQVDVVSEIFADLENLPMWEEFDFELDLFVEPGEFVGRAVELGASRIVVHERFKSAKEAVDMLQKTRGGDYPVMVGIGLKSTDTIEALKPFEGHYDFVEVMGIEREGEQGQPFDPRCLELIEALRAAHSNLPIQVDGHSVGHEAELVKAGATRLIVGSAVIKAENPKEALNSIVQKANS